MAKMATILEHSKKVAFLGGFYGYETVAIFGECLPWSPKWRIKWRHNWRLLCCLEIDGSIQPDDFFKKTIYGAQSFHGVLPIVTDFFNFRILLNSGDIAIPATIPGQRHGWMGNRLFCLLFILGRVAAKQLEIYPREIPADRLMRLTRFDILR